MSLFLLASTRRICSPCVFSAMVLVLSSLMLCNVDAFPAQVRLDDSMVKLANLSEHAWGMKHQQVSLAENCSLFMRFAEAARRRRTRPLLEVKDPTSVSLDGTAIFHSIGMSSLAGLSTTIGAGIVFVLPGNQASPSQMSFLLAMAAGVMLSTTIIEFWLPVLTSFSLDAAIRVLTYSSIGASLFMLLMRLVPESSFLETDPQNPTKGLSEAADLENSIKDFTKAGERGTTAQSLAARKSCHLATMIMFSLTLHNFPEGFAVAVSSLGSSSTGFTVMIAIALHNVPEGIAIAVPVLAATGSRRNALWMTFLSGMAEPLGACVALLLMNTIGIVNQYAIDNLLCMVGGIMVAVAMQELVPEAWSHAKPVSFFMGAVVGASLMLVTIALGA